MKRLERIASSSVVERRSDRRGGSWGFDPAVRVYDRTRSLAPAAMDALLDILQHELGSLGRVLEVGVGTGRLALPLVQRGMQITGVDLSPLMLQRLLEKAARGPRPSLSIGDATRLPFRSRSFDGALLVHVLHLVSNWPEMLRELDRVMRPGGSIVIGSGAADGIADPVPQQVGDAFQRAAGIERRFPGLLSTEMPSFDEVTDSLGWSFRLLPEVQDVQERTIEELIAELEAGTWSWTWDMTEEERRHAAALTRDQMREAYGDIEAPRTFDSRIVFRAYRTWRSASRPM
jgi:ubiquinone/menaquinone biosynthesis C-methylase UbiE